MRKAAFIVLGGSAAVAALLLLLWFVGAIFGLGGSLIHLLLVLALLLVFIGTPVGVILLLVSTKNKS